MKFTARFIITGTLQLDTEWYEAATIGGAIDKLNSEPFDELEAILATDDLHVEFHQLMRSDTEAGNDAGSE